MPDRLVHLSDSLDLALGSVAVVSVRNRRDSQQDAVLVSDRLCAVADGMGGHAGGAQAAQAALSALAGAVGQVGLVAAVAAADDAVRELSDGGWRNPGTTLVALAVAGDERALYGAWVGDSRAYLIDRDGTVTCLTEDHTDFFGGLVRALGDHGPQVWATPETFRVPVGAGLGVLLCSDGVSGPADKLGAGDDRDGAAVLAELLPGGLRHLVTSLAAAGSDNATAVLVDVDAFWAARQGGAVPAMEAP